MANQYFIFPIGRLENVEIDVVGVKTIVGFEVIKIMGDKDPVVTGEDLGFISKSAPKSPNYWPFQ
jgi:hypothetical protein